MSCFEFAEFRLALDTQSLSKSERLISLEPKIFSLLHYFCLNANRAISRDELIESVWQGRVVSHAAINRAVGELRKAIEVDASSPEFIQTVSKVGYKFVAQVSITELKTQNSLQVINPKVDRKALVAAKQTYLLIAVMVFLVCIAAYSLNITHLVSQKSIVEHIEWQDHPLVIGKGDAFKPRGNLSNDEFVYLSRQSSDTTTPQVWIQPSNEMAYAVTDDNYYYTAAILGNNGDIYASRFDNLLDRNCQIVKLHIQKNEPELISDCSSRAITYLDYDNLTNKLYFNERTDVNQPYYIVSLQLATGRKQQITIANANGNMRGDYLFRLSPNAKSLAVVEYLSDGKGAVKLIDLQTNQLTRLAIELPKFSAIDWLNKNTLLISAGQGLYQYSLLDEQLTLIRASKNIWQASVYKKGVIYVNASSSTNIYQHELTANDEQSPIAKTSTRFHSYMPAYRPNSNDLVYMSDQAGQWQFYLSRVNESTIKLPFPEPINHISNLRWSPNGSQLVAAINNSAYLYSFTSQKWQKLNTTIENIHYAAFINEQQLVVSSDHSGDWQLWQVDTEGGEAKLLTTQGGYSAQSGLQKDTILLTKFARDGLFKFNLVTKDEQLLLPDFKLTHWQGWQLIDNSLYYSHQRAINTLILDSDKLPIVTSQLGYVINGQFAISADRRFVAVAKLEDQRSEVRLLTPANNQ